MIIFGEAYSIRDFSLRVPVQASQIALSANTMSREVLPNNVTPLHYDITLEPNLRAFTFEGSLKIDLQINDHSINSVQINYLEIDFHSARIEGVNAIEVNKNENQQKATLVFPNGTFENLGPSAKLEIIFSGILNDQMAGFYRAKYTDKVTGETKYMATTQMEATDARRAFPCFDEPNLKATFAVTLVSESFLTHLSNMDVRNETIKEGKKYTTFNTTPKMSTYLVAFIVADLRYVESNNFRIPVRVYSTPGDEKFGQFAANLAARTLRFFEDTFNIEYPLPKMDMVAVLEFSAGAMENWDIENSSLDRIQRVAEVIQHELAHQWFGNLVTMDWWEGLWLNEGFATWMSWYSCNKFQPEWKVWEQYVTDNLQRALNLDSLRSSHPIEVPLIMRTKSIKFLMLFLILKDLLY
nr:BFH_HP1_G0023700.mRNA.1.CDS.1 [Saccharomyces cerevisiae]